MSSEGAEPLSKAEWIILDALADDIEPIEEVARSLRAYGLRVSAEEFLQLSFQLYKHGFIQIWQAPIEAFGQSFEETYLLPESPGEIVGALDLHFRQAYSSGDYLLYAAITPDDFGGVPFGIYYTLTPAGRIEWNRPTYRRHWPASPA